MASSSESSTSIGSGQHTSMDKKHTELDIRTEKVQDEIYPRAPTLDISLFGQIKHTFTTREGWVGDYDYGALWYVVAMLRIAYTNYLGSSMPRLPFLRRKQALSIFYRPNDSIPIVLAILMGIQRKYHGYSRHL